jgi:hypothetical protein
MGTFYKYRNLENFRRFVEIILNNKLHAAMYKDLNDPMEGKYKPDEVIPYTLREKIFGTKSRIKICSLSREEDNKDLWKKYADNHKGIVVEVKININKYKPEKIKYKKNPPPINVDDYKDYADSNILEIAKEILSHKLLEFEAENEVRIFVKNKNYVDVCITRIITGKKMTKKEFKFIEKLVKRINPKIKISKEKSAKKKLSPLAESESRA